MPNLINKPIHILGAGGIGAALAWGLAREGYSVILVEARSDKVAVGRKEGVTVVGQGAQPVPFMDFDDWTPPNEGFVLLCTKTYDNPAVLARLSDNTFLVPVQNGFDPELERRNHAGEGIASFVSECERDCPVTRITRPGSLHIGGRRSITAAEQAELASLATALGKSKLFPVELVDDVRPYKATKLMYNAAISPLAAAAGVDNGELLTDALAKKLFFGMLQENYAILKHAKIKLARIGPFHPDTVSRILRTPGLPAFMAPIGRTEIEAYNGHLIRLAGDFPCPLNRAAFDLVEKMTREGLQPERKYMQVLADNLPEGVLS
jgi:2-dehydropantoate 2-reductase